jgi:hypothetical protein
MKTSLNLSAAATKFSRPRMAGLLIPILGFFLISVAGTRAWADGVTVAPIHQSQVVPEEGQTVQFDYTITNSNDFAVILDYAFASIFPNGPDPSDTGRNPTFFLGDWFPIIAADVNGVPGTSNWVLSLGVSNGDPCTPTDCDFGINPVTFSTEWSPLVGSALVVPTLVPSWIVFIDNDSNLIPSANYFSEVTNLLNGVVPSSPIDVGGQQVEATGTLVVYDTPEPSNLYLLGTGLLALAGATRRKLRRG